MGAETEHDRIERMDRQIQSQQEEIEALIAGMGRRQEIEDKIIGLIEKLVDNVEVK